MEPNVGRGQSQRASRTGTAARIGDVVGGKWRLDAVLGTGGMATVYAATHRFGRRAAIKMLHRAHSEDTATRQRFLREGLVANRVAHPGAVAVLDVDVTEDGSAFLVMELLEGETINQRWDRCGPPSLEEVLELTDSLLDVLAAAHAAGVVHRDLKPENLHLGQGGRLKVLDFGIARLAGPGLEQTRTGAVLGTPAFMAPEQMRGQAGAVDARSDLWSVGALMFSLLTGHHVHERDSQVEVMVAAASEPARSVGELVSLPVEVERVVDRALAFAPEERFQDARSMQRAVRHALASVRSARGATLAALGYAPTHADEEEAPATLRADDLTDEPTSARVEDRGSSASWPGAGASAAEPASVPFQSVLEASGLGSTGATRSHVPAGAPAAPIAAADRPQTSPWTMALAGGGAACATIAKMALLALLLLQIGGGCRAAATSSAAAHRTLIATR